MSPRLLGWPRIRNIRRTSAADIGSTTIPCSSRVHPSGTLLPFLPSRPSAARASSSGVCKLQYARGRMRMGSKTQSARPSAHHQRIAPIAVLMWWRIRSSTERTQCCRRARSVSVSSTTIRYGSGTCQVGVERLQRSGTPGTAATASTRSYQRQLSENCTTNSSAMPGSAASASHQLRQSSPWRSSNDSCSVRSYNVRASVRKVGNCGPKRR